MGGYLRFSSVIGVIWWWAKIWVGNCSFPYWKYLLLFYLTECEPSLPETSSFSPSISHRNMTADSLPLQNGTALSSGDLSSTNPNFNSATNKKSKESERRRRRRKQKKNKASKQAPDSNADAGNETDEEEAKENADPQPQVWLYF